MSYLEDNPTSRKNLETYLKSHFSKVDNKKADYFLLLAESDAIKFSDTFDKWKNNKK